MAGYTYCRHDWRAYLYMMVEALEGDRAALAAMGDWLRDNTALEEEGVESLSLYVATASRCPSTREWLQGMARAEIAREGRGHRHRGN